MEAHNVNNMVLNICSYNCNSFRNNLEVIKNLMTNHDLIMLQELMLGKQDLYLIDDLSDEWENLSFVQDVVKENIQEGRPKRGVSILFRKELLD